VPHYFYIVAAVVCVVCISYLLQTSVEKEGFFLTRKLARWLFPKLNRPDRNRRMDFIAGILLALFLISALVAFLISHFGRR